MGWGRFTRRLSSLLLVGVLGAGAYVMELQQRENHVWMGVPQQVLGLDNLATHALRNAGFMVGYSELRANPLWATYRLRPVEQRHYLKRPQHFSIDPRTLRRIDHDDYTRSGYDRGHLAPNYAMSQLYGSEAQQASFRMSNITPQKHALNGHLWQWLEETAIDYFAPRFGEVWVMTGPVFDDDIQRLPSGVELPDAFYKIFIAPPRKAGGTPESLAVLIPADTRGYPDIRQFVTSIDHIERLTGLDFFHRLPDAMESRLEAATDADGWNLAEARKRIKPRYR